LIERFSDLWIDAADQRYNENQNIIKSRNAIIVHPILSDKKRVFIYLLVWGVVGILAGLALSAFADTDLFYTTTFTFPLLMVYSQVNLSAWYIAKAFPLERNSLWRVLLVVVVSLVIISIIWTLLAWGWLTVVEQMYAVTLFRNHPLSQVLLMMYGTGKQIFIISLALSYLLVAFENSRNAERRAYELRLLAQTAELKALRMQIDPHFLFNSLNSISALTAHNAEVARTMTMILADFFRKSLMFGAKETITLKEELSLLNHYLDIEKIRFGKRLNIEQNIDDNALNCRIPPLLLQPLLENAIKHGISNTLEGGTVLISAQKKSNRLFLAMENPIDPDAPKKKGTGLGMGIVKKRLQTAFGDDGDLKTFVNEKYFQVIIFLPAMEKP
jgi:two-component system sensor histidine kinase AlgZ